METLLIIFISGLIGGYICHKAKLPLLVGYIGAGIVIGNIIPVFFNGPVIEGIADVAVTLLLFSVGLEFSLHRLGSVLGAVVWKALIQIVATGALLMVVFSTIGFPFIPSLYLSVALAFSSTTIVVKYLIERGEMDTVPGELATAWLAVQDLSVILFIILLSSLSGPGAGLVAYSVLKSLVLSALLIGCIMIAGKTYIPKIFDVAAKSGNRELFLLSIIGILFGFALLFASFGLSAPLGAFLAGLLIAETTQHHQIFAEIRPLRDVFSVLFFVAIGISFKFSRVGDIWLMMIGLTLILVIIKWMVTWCIGYFGGYHPKTNFFISTAMIPVSEFAVVIIGMGIHQGVLTDSYMMLTVGLVFTTVCIGMPFMSSVSPLYYYFSRLQKQFGFSQLGHAKSFSFPEEGFPIKGHVVICGFGRVGKYIGRALDMSGLPYLVVDYNQSVIRSLKEKGVSVVYGDPADPSVLDYAQVDLAKTLIIAIPDRHTQELIISIARKLNKHIKIICRTHHEEDQKRLKSLGVTTVIQPEFEAALSITGRLLSDYGKTENDISGKISRLKIEHGLG